MTTTRRVLRAHPELPDCAEWQTITVPDEPGSPEPSPASAETGDAPPLTPAHARLANAIALDRITARVLASWQTPTGQRAYSPAECVRIGIAARTLRALLDPASSGTESNNSELDPRSIP
ncbi:hypothetical protein ACODT5_28905 [Streptomyces sp. 5.8]|uniref:hypothetical protein n=1 Tax=Streptomyces sp. 5.8 TaxID=3406571 RepID=UPI003BB6C088